MNKQPDGLVPYLPVPAWLAIAVTLSFIDQKAGVLPQLANHVSIFFQFLFSFFQVATSTGDSWQPLFTRTESAIFGGALWLITTIAYGFLTRKWSRQHAFWVAPIAIITVCAAIHLGFSAIDYSLQLESPR